MLLIVTSFFQLIVVGRLVISEYNRRSVSVFLWAMVLVMFSLPHLVSSLLGTYDYETSTLTASSIFVIAFCGVYSLGRHIHLRDRHPAIVEASLNYSECSLCWSRAEVLSIIVFVLVCLSMIAFSRTAVGGAEESSWGALYEAQRDAGISVASFAPFIFSAFCGSLAVSLVNRRWLCAVVLAFSVFIYLLISRNRIIMLAVVIPVLLLVIAKKRRLSIPDIVLYSAIAAFVVLAVYGLLVFRHAGTLQTFLSKYTARSFFSEVLSTIFSNDGELGLRNIFYYFVEHDNRFPGFNSGATYIRLLLFWLPKSLSGGLKPDDFAITMASAFMGNPYNTTYSVHPTFIGDVYANFGTFGVFSGLLWAALFNVLDVWLGRMEGHRKIYSVSAIAYCMILIGRGSVYNGGVIAIAAIVLIKVIDMLGFFRPFCLTKQRV